MKNMLLCVWMGIAAASHSVAGEPADVVKPALPANDRPAGKSLWAASVAAMAATSVMDTASSWGKPELNPGLSGNDGRFGGQGALLKAGIVGGVAVLQALVLRRQPSTRLYRRLAFVNFGSASITGTMAIRNLGIPRR